MLRNVKERGVRYIFNERLERKKNKAAMKNEPGKTGGGGGGGGGGGLGRGRRLPSLFPNHPRSGPSLPGYPAYFLPFHHLRAWNRLDRISNFTGKVEINM